MEPTDPWASALEALNIDDDGGIARFRDRCSISPWRRDRPNKAGLYVILRVLRYIVSPRKVSIAMGVKCTTTSYDSAFARLDALAGIDTRDVTGIQERIVVLRKNLESMGLITSPVPRKEHRCAYCKRQGATRCLYGTRPIFFCDKNCEHAYQARSLPSYYAIPDRLPPSDKFWFVDLPLRLYNAFYRRDVDEAAFVESVSEILRSAKSIKLADALFLGYYLATRSACRNYISHEIYMQGHANPDHVRRRVMDIVFRKQSCSLNDRSVSLFVKGSRSLVSAGKLGNDDADRVIGAFKELNSAVFRGKSATVAASACYYLLRSRINKKMRKADVADAFGIKVNRLYSRSYRAVAKKIDAAMADRRII